MSDTDYERRELRRTSAAAIVASALLLAIGTLAMKLLELSW